VSCGSQRRADPGPRAAWVNAEFEYLWNPSVALPDALIEEVGRLSRKVEVELDGLAPADIA
jgi:hypothetical protein